ncbi:MAG: DUF3379 family protein [Wenzhouxiangellaceae bacterium]|nr:DUF3379 family protein [Wenzhouxiangellaceae bacterium]
MKLAEFKRRLMTEPGDRSPEMLDARAQGGAFSELAQASDAFEARLKRALNVPVPRGLADRIILEQSLGEPDQESAGGNWLQWGAIAAVLALAVALTTFNLADRASVDPVAMAQVPSMDEIREHIRWHWQHDGDDVMAVAAGSPTASEKIERVFAEFGVQLGPALMAQVRAGKFCPTPNGRGAHVVMHTDQGPVTVYYMPRTRVPESPARMQVGDGQPVMLVNLERGSMALIGQPDAPMPDLAQQIVNQLSFATNVTI